MIKKILVAYDGGDASFSAFLFGLDIAKKFDADIEVLSVIQLLEPPEDVETQESLDRGREHYEQLFISLRHKASEQGITIKTEVALGHPAEQIIHRAELEKVDLVLLGHQSRNTFGQWLLGSVPDRVVHHAPCTVIVVKLDHHR